MCLFLCCGWIVTHETASSEWDEGGGGGLTEPKRDNAFKSVLSAGVVNVKNSENVYLMCTINYESSINSHTHTLVINAPNQLWR